MNKELQELFSKAGNMISQLGRYNSNNNEKQAGKALRDIREYITAFFSQSVCIPKGENRHPYADVLHEWIEDMTLPLEWFNDTYHEKEHCGFVPQNDNLLRINKEYRIKPPEPIYECQYVFYDKDKEIARSSFLTEHEYDTSCLSFEWLMDVKSKRVRE